MAGISYGILNIPFIFNQSLIDKNVQLFTPSNMGGVFDLEFLGIKEDKYHFRTKNSDYPFEYEWDDDQLFKKVRWSCKVSLKEISSIKDGLIDDLPNILIKPLFILKDINLLNFALTSRYGFADEKDLGAITNKLSEVIHLDNL